MLKLFAATFVVAAAMAVSPAFAVPVAPLAAAQSDMILHVAGGCGAGWHRGPNGGCRRNFADPDAHACPRGFHIGPGGACRGNGR
jgi:hypothetical protein